MASDNYRVLPVEKGEVQCIKEKRETLDHCRFCVHSRYFLKNGQWVKSPALAFCVIHCATDEVDLSKVTVVKCGDQSGDGFRSIMNVIS